AIMSDDDEALYLAVRIFDILCGILPVSFVASRYRRADQSFAGFNFLALDPVCGKYRESSVIAEVQRIIRENPSRADFVLRP
ncbi:MAG TPA: hypothetical protein VMH92_10360, partial [Acidocella sp.]|nr:hypothetical protein [Acidocella sp.]